MPRDGSDADEFSSSQHQLLYNIVVTETFLACTVQSFIVFMYIRFKDLRKVSIAKLCSPEDDQPR
jgi:hypothetical protein